MINPRLTRSDAAALYARIRELELRLVSSELAARIALYLVAELNRRQP